MTKYRLEIEYLGTGYAGWQRQAGERSIQSAIEDAIKAFSGEAVECYAAGRTDAGVHAIRMAAHVELAKKIPARSILMAANFHLQKAGHTIAVLKVRKAPDDFHARFSCRRRSYVYKILNRPTRPAIDEGRVWWVFKKLDAGLMHRTAQNLIGSHDFSTFRASQCQAASPVKTLDSMTVARRGEFVIVRAAARSFLHRQVRNMVGSLKLVGEGKWTEADFIAAFKACDRTKGGPAAPAEGLYFEKAEY